MNKILVVEDDVKLNQIVCSHLADNGYSTRGCLNANDAYDEMYTNIYDLIISDIMMPNISGFEFAKTVRGINSAIPILFMTARDDIASKQKGFRLGIDDYMVKPIELDELVLRVGALLRRANIAAAKKLSVGNLTLNADENSASVDGIDIPVTVRDFNILFKLLSYPKKTFSRARLIDEFWDMDSETSLRAVDMYITKLRNKFSRCDGFKIVTVHGLGYKAVLNET
jgi:DNA-binding response OmpR family regulator